MPRANVIQQSQHPYFTGARCINREWFAIPMEVVWEIMCRHLTFIWHAYDARILAFVLMTNHWHLLLQTPKANISEILWYFMANTSRDLTFAGNRINQTYGGRSYKSVIMTDHDYLNAYKYLYRNPVKAGMCKNVEQYKYSSLHGMLGQQWQPFPVAEDQTLFSDIPGSLNWLNQEPKESDWNAIRLAIRRPTFQVAKNKSNKPHHLEYELL